ncbi:MAG: hypothetical protein ABSC46_12595 [Candidatus Limnocylindrales bacterium]|jgi:hypothetical protein
MTVSLKRTRGFVAIGLAIGLIVAACSNSSPVQNPLNPGGGNNGGGSNGGGSSSLVAGLSSNLDSLTSYQFSESMAGSSSGSQATPASTSSVVISGTVVNKPTRSISMNAYGVQYILVGTQAWTSYDAGNTWTSIDPTDASLTDLLPGKNYASWFDAYSTNFKVAGDESKNGVQCTHYKGDSSLGSLYQGITGVSASFQADLWVAKDGNYPVSGVYGFSAASGNQAGSFGYSFDVTHINDGSNQVTPPANVVPIPS